MVSRRAIALRPGRPAVQLVAVTLVALLALYREATAVQTLADLWLTRDQQGLRALRSRDYARALERFEDPAWQGIAAYRAGRYELAAAAFGRLTGAEGFYNRGNALYRARDYRGAVRAYEQAVALAPAWAEANDNLALARWTRDYIEEQREQTDTGDERELGADDVSFDNEEKRGKTIEITRDSTIEQQSAEKWMRTVDTRTADFLRMRFRIELLERERDQ
ncbi:MAG: tetratricopeptide repeat protein [Pseudohaliea sp.]